jgi:hypothetical protein
MLSSIRSSTLRSHGQQRSPEKRELVSTESNTMRMCALWAGWGRIFVIKTVVLVCGWVGQRCCNTSLEVCYRAASALRYFTYVIHLDERPGRISSETEICGVRPPAWPSPVVTVNSYPGEEHQSWPGRTIRYYKDASRVKTDCVQKRETSLVMFP